MTKTKNTACWILAGFLALVCMLVTQTLISQEKNTRADSSQSATAVGDASFNAADRLAVINLISSYGYFYDQFNMDGFRSLFVSSPVFEFWQRDTKIVGSLSDVVRDSLNWRKLAVTEKNKRRHFLTPVRFDRETGSEASGQVYLQFYATKNSVTSLEATGAYEFTAVRVDGTWKLSRWIGRIDAPFH